ncbi:MAG: hypothetical protein GY845_09385 [Planctomycetes bacterium]|nr:hypothetical protein [Planctomycetota bacterium]
MATPEIITFEEEGVAEVIVELGLGGGPKPRFGRVATVISCKDGDEVLYYDDSSNETVFLA